MKFLRSYLLGSVVVGVLAIVDGALLIDRGITTFGKYFSLLEAAWAVVSIPAIFVFKKNKLPFAIPLSFVAYNILGWIYGLFLYSEWISDGKAVSSFDVPMSSKIFGICFGIYFALVNIRIFNKKS